MSLWTESFPILMGSQWLVLCCDGICSPVYTSRWSKARQARGCLGKISSPFTPSCSHRHEQPTRSDPGFVLCQSNDRLLIVLPLNLFYSSLCHSLSRRKCWTSAKTEGAVKSLSTAASLGQTSVLAAANTSLSGTNADPVSPNIYSFFLCFFPHINLYSPSKIHQWNNPASTMKGYPYWQSGETVCY